VWEWAWGPVDAVEGHLQTCKLAAIENSLTIDNGKNNRKAKRQQLVVLVGSQNSIAVTFQCGYPGFGQGKRVYGGIRRLT